MLEMHIPYYHVLAALLILATLTGCDSFSHDKTTAEGTIVHAENNEPLEDIGVALYTETGFGIRPTVVDTTDARGRFEVASDEPRVVPATIVANDSPYSAEFTVFQFSVQAEASRTIRIELEPTD